MKEKKIKGGKSKFKIPKLAPKDYSRHGGHGYGRPTPSDEEKIAIGLYMIEYAANNPSCLTMPMIAAHIEISIDALIEWSDTNTTFGVTYRTAKNLVGINRLKSTMITDKDTPKLGESIYRGTIWNYDSDIKKDMRDEKSFEASLKQPETSGETLTPEQLINLKKIIDAKLNKT